MPSHATDPASADGGVVHFVIEKVMVVVKMVVVAVARILPMYLFRLKDFALGPGLVDLGNDWGERPVATSESPAAIDRSFLALTFPKPNRGGKEERDRRTLLLCGLHAAVGVVLSPVAAFLASWPG